MRTPAGFDCKYFYGDYYRGNNREECRLINHPINETPWTRDLCSQCPVPRILLANACPNMEMDAHVVKHFLGLRKQVVIHSYCTFSKKDVAEPEIGCGKCHEIPPMAVQKEEK
jgi:hypothetical protein